MALTPESSTVKHIVLLETLQIPKWAVMPLNSVQ